MRTTARARVVSRPLPLTLVSLTLLGACADSSTAPPSPSARETADAARAAPTFTITELSPIGIARAVNRAGAIVGEAAVTSGATHAVLWRGGAATDLGTLDGGQFSSAWAISPKGLIAGASETSSGDVHAALWRDGDVVDLGTLGGSSSQATGVNDRGQVVGWSVTSSGATHAFVWEDGIMHDLGTLGGPNSRALAIDAKGEIVGWSETAPAPFITFTHAVRWLGGEIADLGGVVELNSSAGAINRTGQIAGWAEVQNGQYDLALWRGQRASVTTTGSSHFLVNAIDDRGDVVGLALVGTGDHAFYWRGGTLTDLGTLEPSDISNTSIAYGVNDAGTVVGASTTHDGLQHAVMWTPVVRRATSGDR
ncbi:MAG TPA: hypothetical protein VFS44_00585 [Gemmatimonadaceae bacterium]|nr:hypothetical protein [Gemmatimonadaceae bacterium]